MKFTIDKQTFQAGVENVAQCLSERPEIVALNYIRLEVSESELNMRATDLDTTVIVKLPLQDSDDIDLGAVLVPGRLLVSVLREMRSEPIELCCATRLKAPRLYIEARSGVYKLPTLPASNFPKAAWNGLGETKTTVKISSRLLCDMLKTVLVAVSKERYERREALRGCRITFMHSQVAIVGTDGHRLIEVVAEIPGNTTCNEVVLPRKAAEMIIQNVCVNDCIDMYLDEKKNSVMFRLGKDVTVMATLIAEKYPNVDRLWPNSMKMQCIFEKQDVVAALRRLSVVSDKLTALVKMSVQSDRVDWQVENKETGACGFEEGPANLDLNGELTIGFNAVYMVELLRAIKTDSVEIGLNDADQPIVISPVNGNAECEKRMLLAPIRTKEL